MREEKFLEMYKNTKKEEIIKELYYKCKANYKLNNIIDKAIDYIDRRDIEWGSEEHNTLLEILKEKEND